MRRFVGAGVVVAMMAAGLLGQPQPARAETLWQMYGLIKQKQWVDLTHPFDADIPHWKGFQPMTRKTLYDYDKDGFRAELFCHVGQWGTHVDPPAHFHKGKATLDQLPIKDMLLPLVVIDVHDKVARNPDYTLQVQDVTSWELKHGRIPAGAFVAMRTDWSKRWPDQAKMQNVDDRGVAHYPGWSLPVLKLLYEKRGIAASGHETTDTDPGTATTKDDYSLESYILGQGHYQIELMADLDKLPPTGALISVTWPDLKDGSGFPARVFAILP